MKLLRTFLATLFALCCVCACASTPAPPTNTEVVSRIDQATVALVLQSTTSLKVYCTGVWVSADTILTAAHCAEGVNIGGAVLYVPTSETPPLVYIAALVKTDNTHDLALLRALLPGAHLVAIPSFIQPEKGASLHFVGHTVGMTWTYVRGYVSSYRDNIGPTDEKSSYMQVSAPVYFGNSGGGAFTDDGALVGILSFMRNDVPNMAFCVPLKAIRAFLSL